MRSVTLSCWLYCKKDSLISRLQHIDRYRNLEVLRIEGMGSREHALGLSLETLEVPLEKLPKLKEVTFYGYDIISAIPAWVLKCPQIQRLILTETGVTEIPDQIAAMTGLKELSVLCMHTSAMNKWNPGLKQISRLPAALQGLKKLNALTLHYLHFSHLASDLKMLAKIPSLRSLSLIDCNIDTLPKETGLLTNIEVLDISSATGFDSNTFQTVPAELYRMTSLKKLVIDRGLEKSITKSKLPAGCEVRFYDACFPPSAKVLMANGNEKNIDQVQPGDTLMSYNSLTQAFETSIVRNVVIHHQKTYALWKLHIERSALTASSAAYIPEDLCVTATPNHPFLLSTGETKSLSGLSEKDSIRFFDADAHAVKGARVKYITPDCGAADAVYNLVTDKDNYFIDKINAGMK